VSEACKLCKGACCESLLIPIDRNPMVTEFYDVRSVTLEIKGQPFAKIESRCPLLKECGRCRIYASRPVACIRYEVGSPMCLATVERRRIDQAEAIKALM
jgi:Fe-S-cluster containining protein